MQAKVIKDAVSSVQVVHA